MKKISIILVALFCLTGCAHVSVTGTDFDGKTKGLNPYGDGEAYVTRVSAWGTSETLILRAMDIYQALVLAEEIDTELSSGKEENID